MSAGRGVLIIGSSGFVGGHLACEAERAGYEVTRGERAAGLDVANPASVAAALDRSRPDAVVLLAALSDIDRCEAEPRLASRVNVEGALNVARACAAAGVRLLFTSSGAVFDGAREGYSEDDAPTPVSVYGKTKAEAERKVAMHAPGALIVRFGLVLGFVGWEGMNFMFDGIRTWGTPPARPSPIDSRCHRAWSSFPPGPRNRAHGRTGRSARRARA